MPWAAPGILTGVLVATGIALGETAPLIYTAGWSNYMPSLAPTHSPVGYLTYVVWSFISQPFSEAHELAYAAAALLMLFIFVTNLVSRVALEAWSAKRA
jgi:phosphate transport system permease protein